MPRPGGTLRVLHVDDDAVNRLVLDQMLLAFAHRPRAVAGAAEALDALRAKAFDLVMTDLHMPHGDGLQLLAAIRSADAGDPSIPVIAVSADVMSRPAEAYVGLGFAGFLAKPLTFAGLEALLDEVRFGPERLTFALAQQAAQAYARAAGRR